MKSRLLLLLAFAVGMGSALNAQLDNYKYIIVPKQFSAFNKENRHQTSTTVKYLFSQKGFAAVYDDSLPEELANNRCLGLLVELEDSSNMFSTKTSLVLKDCQGDEVYRTIEGRSKIKEYRSAYREALGKAFAPIQAMMYSYTPKEAPKEEKKEAPITVSFKNDIKTVEEKPTKPSPRVVEQVATQEEQSFKSMEPVASNMKKVEKAEAPAKNLLYAQPTENGYQLVDSTPKVVLKLIKTSVDNIYLVDDDTRSGMVFKKGDKWLLEYSDSSGKKQEELNIKF
ncbi:hypothetical protein [Flagellimonas algicola]|uniref:Uncharacterized protein n=1 Tax=Flagellimonas algicola TaxID=2583815 RepID=A0ABY2WSF9_9FLAO|nr:hypothetical protein [Allomuricauda algicola]TMU57591.1 hypothetical protein FGG15_08605 [Allomuricauda algicola]